MKIRQLTYAALFVALTTILKVYATVFLFGSTKFGLSFIPSAIGSAVLGPVWGGIIGGLSDVIGYLIKQDGTYFPGFTASAIAKGILYGLFLYKKPKNLAGVTLAVLTTVVFLDFLVNAVWINILYGTAIKAVLISKLVTLPLYAGLQILILYILFKYLSKEISKISE
jgi:ECF transporter S component (folate family)